MKINEINVRVWNSRSKEMIYFNLSQLNILREIKMHWEIYNLMVATRIKDQRGKDLFEGDIVKADGYFGEFLAEVIFDTKKAQFKLKNTDGEEFNLWEVETEGISYSRFAIAFPFGIGVKYSLTNTIGLTLEWGMRKTTTDYLDDVSTAYSAKALGFDDDLNPQPVAPFDPSGNFREGMQRGNSKDNDWYSFAGLSVVFRINFRGKADCNEPHRMRF